jgi:integrase
METHDLMDGRVHVYKRPNTRFWQCSTYLAGKNRRQSTKQESLAAAKDFAEEWYFDLRGKSRSGEIKGGKTFRAAAQVFLREYQVITQGQRSPKYVKSHEEKLNVHLLPFFGPMHLSDITPGKVQDYRIDRIQNPKPIPRPRTAFKPNGKLPIPAIPPPETKFRGPPSRKTLENEMITLRQVLKAAQRHGWIQFVPDFSAPYKMSGKVSHRAWFSPTEYRQLYMATRQRAKQPLNNRWRWESEQLHDYVLFMANTGLRPDESARLEYRDVNVVRDAATDETILEIEVRGKRGVGYCKSTTGAVQPFFRLKKRNQPKPTDRLFPGKHRGLFNRILEELELKTDRDGHRRTAYSLRHTYICMRLMEGADIYQIAKNCRTSVEMIEKHYAVHLKTTLDAAAINVRKPKPAMKKPEPKKT